MKTLIIDNYDSFTFNLYQLVGKITGTAPTVIRNDNAGWDSMLRLDFDCVIISPGPGRPERELDFGLSKRAILELSVPLLGVCLGHQGICHAFGGSVAPAPEPMHGRLSSIYHDSSALFENLPNPFSAVRYHSLVCAQPLPPDLLATAWTGDGIVMGLAHRTRPIWGVQFHPESIATEHGQTILTNFLELTRKLRPARPEHAPIPSASHRPSRMEGRLFVRRVPATVDSAQLFAALFAHLANAFWLDSSLTSGGRARFSFMGGASESDAETVRYYVAEQKLVVQNGPITRTYGEEVLTYLDRKLGERAVASTDLPFDFNCGYIGYFGYELKALCGAPAPHRSTEPDCILIFAGKCIAIDHQKDELYLLYSGQESDEDRASQWFAGIMANLDGRRLPTTSTGARNSLHFVTSRTRDEYLDNIAKCLEHIRNGESYEVCLTNKLRAGFAGDPWEYYKVLRRINPAPYSAYLKFPDVSVACSSPERFLKVGPSGAVESKPIKGTMRRGADAAEDDRLKRLLSLDIKSQAENLMIVDLLRNDLGKVCEFGSVCVPELMKVETYATLHQLVSTITGQLGAVQTAVDCFRAAFPGGSMTGAPKLRTMAIIDELEREARGVYSGSIGYFALNGSADLNIVIRTAVFSHQSVSIGVGGAIVAMSEAAEEWREILLKAQALLSAFESIADITVEWQDLRHAG
jgi:para-aminobenzoate synthetase